MEQDSMRFWQVMKTAVHPNCSDGDMNLKLKLYTPPKVNFTE